jgi:DNA-binding transcriptional MocR family regulator
MSYQASNWAAAQCVGDRTVKIILLLLANRASHDGKDAGAAWPKLETLAREAEVSKSTVQRSLKRLEERGLIKIEHCFDERGGQIASKFRLLMDNAPTRDVGRGGHLDDHPPVSPGCSPP